MGSVFQLTSIFSRDGLPDRKKHLTVLTVLNIPANKRSYKNGVAGRFRSAAIQFCGYSSPKRALECARQLWRQGRTEVHKGLQTAKGQK